MSMWSRSCHHVSDTRDPQGRLCLAATGIVARITVHWFVLLKVPPVEVGRKVRATLYMPRGIDMNRPDPGAARLEHLTANVSRDLLQVVVGVRDNATAFLLELEQ